MSKLITQYEYYKEQQSKCTDEHSLLLMARGEAYYILGKNAAVVLPIVKKALTHKDAGAMYCYQASEYGYENLSFGKHNLYRLMPKLVEYGYRVAITDFDIAFREAGGWEEVDRILRERKEKQQEYERKHRQPVQLTLFEAFGL